MNNSSRAARVACSYRPGQVETEPHTVSQNAVDNWLTTLDMVIDWLARDVRRPEAVAGLIALRHSLRREAIGELEIQ